MSPGKRVFDLLGAGCGLLVLAPLFGLLAILIKLDDGGSVFFRQERIGHRGRPFRMWKFRTMIPDAARHGLPLTVGRDSRVTRVGRWMRRVKLDELPQLFNVLAGDMTLVGPRPEIPRYVAMYGQRERKVLELVPGITDDASLRYVNEEVLLGSVPDPERWYLDELAPEKIRLSLAYARRATRWSDLRVILATLRRLFLPRSLSAPDPARPHPGTDAPRSPVLRDGHERWELRGQ